MCLYSLVTINIVTTQSALCQNLPARRTSFQSHPSLRLKLDENPKVKPLVANIVSTKQAFETN